MFRLCCIFVGCVNLLLKREKEREQESADGISVSMLQKTVSDISVLKKYVKCQQHLC